MSASDDRDKRIRTWLSFGAGMVWTGYFAIANPDKMPPVMGAIIGGLLFGPSIITGFFGGGKKNE